MSAKPKRDKPLVMIVDDDQPTRELFATYLEPEYSVVLVSSATAAVEVARRLLPDLIVTDVLMPGMGGLQTLFVLRNTPETSDIPAIVVSVVHERTLSLMPAATYLTKPVDQKQFVETVRKHVKAAAGAQT